MPSDLNALGERRDEPQDGSAPPQPSADDVDMVEVPPGQPQEQEQNVIANGSDVDVEADEINEEAQNADVDVGADVDDADAAAAAAVANPFYGFEEEEPNFESKDLSQVLQIWEAQHTTMGFDPVPALKRLAEIMENETEIYMRRDPDPFDERHPHRTDPTCQFGFLLKQLFRKDIFMNKLVNDYLRDNYFTRQNVQKSSLELNILACRLILVIMPGLETSAVFQVENDNLINRIYSWAEDSIEPLQSYATGLLAAAMEVTDIAVTFRELYTRLVPKMIKRLHMLQAIYKSTREAAFTNQTNNSLNTSLESEAIANTNACAAAIADCSSNFDRILPAWMAGSAPQSPQHVEECSSSGAVGSAAMAPVAATPSIAMATGTKRSGIILPSGSTLDSFATNSNMSALLENSRDAFCSGSGKHYYKKMYIPIHPPTAETSQMLIMRYLTAMGEYQEFLALVFENNAMQLIFGYIENLQRRDTCLAFEALKYLASLLCHKKFALEFIAHGGLERLLKVPRPSIAATGVSITLYYLAYSEDAMERICTMSKPIITELVRYALWLLERSYDSGTCHATMFFGLSFQFKVILDEFDAQDGLRKLHNVISVLKILNPSSNDDDNSINEDVECAARQLVRHVCVALKRYMESHLFYKYNAFMRQQCPSSSEFSKNITKATKASMEQISEQIRTLQENTSVRCHWAPVDQLLKLGGITLLLKIITLSYDWNNVGRSEIARSALDVLSICCVIPKVFVAYCYRMELPDNLQTSGIYSILGAAAGDISADADVQKSALAVLVHCVCLPIARREPNPLIVKCFSNRKTKNNRYSEELVEKVWESVCSNNGIIVLLSLMQTKVPITDADCIRGMACRALAGLARSERVRQIVGKLPLFASGQIQTLMRDPILQEKRAEHVIFQKYALELLERVSGKTKPLTSKMDPSLSNIHKANVIAQTKIQYNEQQLYQLIHDHLESKGMMHTAQMLQKEAGLQLPSTTTKNFHQSPFDYKVLPTSSMGRNRLRNRMHDVQQAINVVTTPNSNEQQQHHNHNSSLIAEQEREISVTPIKLVKKSDKIAIASSATASANALSASSGSASQRSLQKQITSVPEDSLRDANGSPINANAGISLTSIVTEYLTNQHALCNNPMATCPQFDLFTPHKCPDPKPNRVLGGTNINLTARFFKAQAGYNTARLDRRFVHTHFAPWRTIRATEYNAVQFSCCDFVPSSNLLITGTQQGEAKAFNINDGTEEFSSHCHDYIIDSIKSNKSGDLVLTSCSWRSPLSKMWSIRNNEFASKLSFNDEFYCEFSNLIQDKVLGTTNNNAVIYDVNTGNKISTFTPIIANQYIKNRATFCPTDELILSDGVLWDVRSGKEIHKFDKLNQQLSGVFHPNGLEIISNTEVWDLRTFHLLQTVPVLDQCHVKFSPMKVIYGISLEIENRAEFDDSSYETSFKVLDAYDYSSIATIDVKRNIYDMSVNGYGSLIAMVENQEEETYCKIYAVGMKKREQRDEEDDEERDSGEEGSDSDSSDIFDIDDNGAFPFPARRRRRNRSNADNDNEDNDMDNDDDDNDDDDDDDDDGDDDDEQNGWIDILTGSDDSFDEDDNDGNGGNGAAAPPRGGRRSGGSGGRRSGGSNGRRSVGSGGASSRGRSGSRGGSRSNGRRRPSGAASSSSESDFMELRFRLA